MGLTFHVEANRFLRGMVRALVATQLQVGRGKKSIADFISIIAAKDCTRADFSAPAHGLFLEKVNYPHPILSNPL
jgi:tRNA pseudouridine38-40 synthase